MWYTYIAVETNSRWGSSCNASCERFAAARTTGETFSYGERVDNRVGGFFIVGANY